MQSGKTDDMQVMILAVEEYIRERTGQRVKIMFNNMQRFPQHFEMLVNAYAFVQNYKNTKK
jgi:hypothetical protein